MFNISLGVDAEAYGIGCISIGDGVVTRGLFQVEISDKVTLPNDLTKASAVATLRELDKLELLYASFVEQKFAPEEFESKYKKAVTVFKDLIEKHFGKGLQGLLNDISSEALEMQRNLENARSEKETLSAENEALKKKLAELQDNSLPKPKGKVVARK